MTKIIISGLCGRMGREVALAAMDDKGVKIVGAVEWPGHPDIGKSLREVIGARAPELPVSATLKELNAFKSVVIDFSTAEATMDTLTTLDRLELPAVIGITGLDEHCQNQIKKAARLVPIVLAPNMSMGVNLLAQFVRRAAEVLGPDYDVEIVETHHRGKLDSPSGTALKFAAEAAAGRNAALDKLAVYGRGRGKLERQRGQIGISSVRGGTVVGEHEVRFLGDGEVVTFAHSALSRSNFAKGALAAAKWVEKQEPGLYTMADVLGLKQ